MREKINYLAMGDVDVENPKISLEPSFIEAKVKLSAITRVEFNINTQNNILIKALLYSSNYRVKLLYPSFGGINNKIILEVDALHLNLGDIIEGEIKAVTNAGEFVIPYRFTTFSNKTSIILNELKTIKDFLFIYKEDREVALKIFEFKDFVAAPFMSYFKYRALYDNLITKNNKENSLEEFFVCLEAKNRIDIYPEKEYYIFDNLEQEYIFELILKKNTYGYFNINLKSDVDFLEISENKISDKHFQNNIFVSKVKILYDKLKSGKNIANISLKNAYINKNITIEINQKNISIENKTENKIQNKKEYINNKKRFISYLKYRLEYEYSQAEEKEILSELMQIELEDISSSYPYFILVNLCIAETFFISKKYDKALDIIELVKDDIEDKNSFEYIFMTYMLANINNNFEILESLKTFIQENNKDNHLLSLLYFKLNQNMSESQKHEYLLREFSKANRSPFLYLEYIKLINENLLFLHNISKFELLALIYAVKANIISDELNNILSSRLSYLPINTSLSYHLLVTLYNKYQEDEYLYYICKFIIRADIRDEKVNKYLKLAIDKNINISLLYEYYIYSLDKNNKELLDSKIFAYFKKNNLLDIRYKSILYKNILEHTNKEDDLYKLYIYDIEKFVYINLKAGRIDDNLAYIYNKVIKIEMLDAELFKNLFSILNTYKLSTNNKQIKSIAIIYPELKKEFLYNIEDKKAYIPIFSENAIILECDKYANRYAASNIKLEKLLDLDNILSSIYEISSKHFIFKLEYTKKILDKETLNEKEVEYLEEIIKNTDLSDYFKNYIFSKLIYYYRNLAKETAGLEIWENRSHDILLKANKDNLDNISKSMLTDAYISMGYFYQAYEMLQNYKCFNLSIKNINILTERLIMEKVHKSDYLLLYLAFISFSVGNKSSIVLDYLCEYYNNDSKSMYDILEVAIEENVNTYDLEERLLSQLIFTNNIDLLDQVFAWYVSRKKSSEILVRAYFAIKSSEYVLYDYDISNRLIEYLENAITKENNLEDIPIIYKLAILKYYSKADILTEDRKEYAKNLLENLINNGIELPFYKNLSKFIELPNNLEDKQILLYIANNSQRPILYSRTLKEEEFKQDEFINIYRNMYVKTKMLFDDELWEYQIFDEANNLLSTGDISNLINNKKIYDSNSNSRFDLINEIINEKEEDKVKVLIEDFILKDIFTNKIFDLM